MKDDFKNAENFAKTYYQLDKSEIETVHIKSAIRFAERYHQEQLKLCDVMQVKPEKVCECGSLKRPDLPYCKECTLDAFFHIKQQTFEQ